MPIKPKNAVFLLLLTAIFAFTPALVVLGQKSYHYQSIAVSIEVNKDSTFDVEERQTFVYSGQFNKGWRSISLKKISAISDIEVIEAETGKLLTFSRNKLEKTDPANWGKYTHYKANGAQNIEWYYNAADTSRAWIIKYKVHGGIGFYKDHDEIYWNLFTDYEVPVESVYAFVKLPENNFPREDFQTKFYASSGVGKTAYAYNNSTFYFSAAAIQPHQALTIAVGWPKGLVSQSAFWIDFIKINYGYALSVLIVFLSVLSGFLYWYFTEKHKKGRGVIIPQYEPPGNLKPAMAAVLCYEGMRPSVWPATIVDLAVRGYVRITEDKSAAKRYWIAYLFALPVFSFIFIIAWRSLARDYLFFIFLLILGLAFLFTIAKRTGGKIRFWAKDYIIEKIKDYESDPSLEDYERNFLGIIFTRGNSFSTKKLEEAGNSTKRAMFAAMQKLKELLYEETESDTGVFEKRLSQEKKMGTAVSIIIILGVLGLKTGILFNNQYWLLGLAAAASAISLFAFIRYESRLSATGHILKEDWLGFKMYLETAEKYRMQNLTPDIFEKYLPYAMIFKVEKKWGRAFDGLNMPAPSWYAGAAGVAASGGIAGGFSPSGFSASFSSSLSSAFASSGASGGGGGGGGGGAGGGGGGGGGGAS